VFFVFVSLAIGGGRVPRSEIFRKISAVLRGVDSMRVAAWSTNVPRLS